MGVDAQVGTVIIRRDLLLPLGTKLPSEAYCRNWNSIKPADARGIEAAKENAAYISNLRQLQRQFGDGAHLPEPSRVGVPPS